MRQGSRPCDRGVASTTFSGRRRPDLVRLLDDAGRGNHGVGGDGTRVWLIAALSPSALDRRLQDRLARSGDIEASRAAARLILPRCADRLGLHSPCRPDVWP